MACEVLLRQEEQEKTEETALVYLFNGKLQSTLHI